MGVASVLIASGAWFQDKDKVDSNVTLGHIELNDNFKRFTQFTIPIVLSRQNVLEEDILFTPSVDTGNLYVRFKVSYPIMANTSLRARDVQHYQKITPFTTSDQNHVNFGHKWVQVGEYFYFCDENGVPSILTKNDHKENEEDYYVFLQKDALTISSRMSKNLFAENEELTLQISVEAIQSDNVNSEIDENGQIIAGQDGIVDGIDDIVYAFSEQYPTDKYEWEFISESGSLINNFKDLRYGDKVELPTHSVSSDKTFVEWNTSADGTGAPITNDVIESITESKKVYAIVHQNEVKISVNAGPNGTIKPYSPEINGYMVDYATDQAFEIVPDIGYKISSITVDGSNVEIEAREGMSQKYTFSNITVEHSISATFEAREFVITYNTLTENSSGEPTFVSSVTNVRYPNQHSIDITPPQGYSISSILVDNIALAKEAFDPTGHTIDFGVVTQDHIVVATFSRIKYTITYHKNGGQEETGKENPTTIYITDEARDLNPVLKTNNIFVGWYDNSSFNGSIIKQIPANPTGNLNYYAKFIEQSTLERTANYGYQIFPNFDYDFAGIKVVEENGLLHIKYDATTASGSNISLTPAKTYVKVGNSYVEKTLADFGSINNLRVKITSKNQTNFGTLANSGSTSLQNVPGSSNNDYYYFSAQNFKSLISNKNVTSFDAILETIEAITPAQTSTNGDVSLIIATNSALPQGLSYAFVWMGPNGTISNQEISSHESIVLGQSTLNSAFYTATQSGEYSCQVSIKDENNNNVITPFKISWTIDINRDIHFTQMSNITKTYDAKPAVPKVSDLPIGATVTYSYTGTLANGSLVSGFGNSFVDAGEYEVTALINGGKYYTNSTSTCTVKINRATLSIPDALKAVTVLPGSTFVNPLTSPTVASEDISGITFSSNIASVQINQTTGILTILSDKNIDRQTATITIDGGNNFVGLSYTISQHPFMFSNSTTLSSYVGTESDVVVPETITDVNKIANGIIQATKENAFTPTTIESGAFSNIANLKTLTFPTATTTLKTGAISSCPSLQKIITKSTLSSNYSLSGIRDSGSWYRGGVEVAEITIAGIYNNSGIIEGSSAEWEYSNGTITAYLGTSVNIRVPHRIYNIQTGQFDTVTKIESIIGGNSQIIPSEVKTVIISENITEIGESAFNSYHNLEKVVLPTTLEVVGDSAFSYSSNINSAINLGACTNLKSIGDGAFFNCGNALMGTIDLSGATQLSSLGSLCFGAAPNLTEFRLPSNIQTIGQEINIFGADYNLSKITASGTHTAENNNVLYNSAKTILYAYAPKNSRTTYSIPDSVTTIVGFAFCYANSLEQITLGSNLTSVGWAAFSECPKLMRINVPTGKSSTYASILSGSSEDNEKGFNNGCLMYENGVPTYGYVASTYKWEKIKTIELTIDGNGTGQVECNGETYTQNSTIYVIPSLSYTLTLTPNSGSFIKSVFVDQEEIKLSQSNSESFKYRFSNITSTDHTFAVTFQTKVFEIYDGTSSFFFDNLQDAVSFAQQKYPSTLVQLSLFVDYTSATPVSFEDVWFDYNSLKTLNVPINLGQNSKLNILGGTFVAQITQNSGSLIVNGGKLSSLVTNDGTATINDGTITSLTSSADITIQGGNVTTLKLNNSSTATLGTPVVTNAILDADTGSFGSGAATGVVVEEYKRVEHLDFTGSQYINTGIIPTANIKTESSFVAKSGDKWLFGSRTSTSATNIYGFHITSNTSVWYQIKTNSSTTQKQVSAYFNKKSSLTTSRSEFTFNGQTFSGLGADALGASTLPMYVGALNNNGTADGRYFVGELYSFKIWDGTTLVRDFVPVVRTSDGAAGLLDLVENKFYQSISSQQFVTPSFGSKLNQTQPLSQPINLTVSSPVQGQVVVTGTPTQSNYKLTNKNHSLVLEGEQIKIYSAFDVRAYARGSATNSGTHTSIGGVIEPSSVLLKLGEKTTLTAVADQGWRFGGWYTSVDGNGKPNGTKLSASETIEISYANGMASIYYAHFIKTQTIKINFESIVSSPADVTITANDSISVSPETISSTGSVEVVFDYSISNKAISATVNSSSNKYNLIWSTTPTAEQTTSAVSTTVSASADSTISLTLTQLFTITYDANGGTGTVANQTVAFRQPFTTNNGSSLSRSGYSLSGWNTSSDGNGTNYMPNQNVTTYSDANDITLYAMWKGNASKVTFDPQTMTPNFTGSQTLGGLTITNNGDGTITFNGTLTGSTNSIAIADVYVAQGQNIDVYMTYVSGARSFSGACFVTEISRDGTTSQRPIDRAFLDINNGNSPDSNPGVRTKSGSIPVDSPTRAACEKFFFWMWKSDTGTATFDNYCVKFEVSPAPQKEVYVGETYGELPIPQRAGYKFESWNGGSKNMATYLTPSDWGGTSSAEDLNNGKHILTTHGDWSTFRLDLPNYVGKKVTISGIIKSITATNSSFSGLYVGQAGSAAYPRHIPNSSDKLLIANSSTQIPENGLYFSKTCTIATGAENYTFIGLTLLQSGWSPSGICELVIENLQIEVSDSATDFESPIKTVTSSTIVTNQHDHDLLATWSPVSYQIAYDPNGGAGRMDNSTHTYGVAKALSKNTFSRDGYEFVGWATQSDGNGTSYSDEQMVTNLANAQDAIVTLYAKWTGKAYNITLDLAGGTGGSLSKTTYQTSSSQDNITITNPTRTGYQFLSYNLSNPSAYIIDKNKTQKTLIIPANTFGDITITPIWQANQYTVTFNPNGGSVSPTTKPVTYDSTYGTLPTPTRPGYTFAGWSKNMFNPEFANSLSPTCTRDGGTFTYNTGSKNTSNSFQIQTWNNTTYLNAGLLYTSSTGISSVQFTKDSTITRLKLKLNGSHEDSEFFYNISSLPDGIYVIQVNVVSIAVNKIVIKDVMIEQNSNNARTSYVACSTYTKSNSTVNEVVDRTLFAHWTPNNYTITIDPNGGTGGTTSLVYYYSESAQTVSFSPPTRKGYTLSDWTPSGVAGAAANGSTITIPAKADNNITLTAKWTPNTYHVTYHPNGGNGTQYTVDIVYDTDFVLLSNSDSHLNFTKEGHSVDYWLGNNGSNWKTWEGRPWQWTYDTDVILYAQWTPNTYHATYTPNGGVGNDYKVDIVYGQNFVLLDNTDSHLGYTRDGYKFYYWNEAANGSGSSWIDYVGKEWKWTYDHDITLYAQWNKIYDVVYTANGGTGADYTTKIVKTEQFVLLDNTDSHLGYTRTGYTFSYWSTTPDGSDTSWKSYINKPWTWSYDYGLTFHAIWTPNTYTISYNGNGNTGGSTASSTHTYDEAKNLTANGFTKTGYTFAGWATSPSGNVVHADKASVKNLSATQGATVTLYAKWTINSYTLSIDPNGGYRVSDNSTAVITVTKNYKASENISERRKTGYTLTGYTLKNTASGSTTDIGGATFTFNNSTKTGVFTQGTVACTLVAQWTAITYTIQYNGNGATGGSTASSTHTYDVYKALTANGFKRTGYTFAGWKKDNAGPTYSDKQSVTNLANTQGATVTLYAQWTAETYAATFENFTMNLSYSQWNNGGTWKSTTTEHFYISNSNTGNGGPYVSGFTNYMTDGEKYKIQFTARATSNMRVTANFEASSSGGSKLCNLKVLDDTYSLTFTYNASATNKALTFYSENWTGQTLYIKDIKLSKIVTYNSTYGTLPTPSRTGYTFAGWSKSSFDINEWMSKFILAGKPMNSASAPTIVNTAQKSITLSATGGDCYTETYNGNTRDYQIPVKTNTNYVFSWKQNSAFQARNFVFLKTSLSGYNDLKSGGTADSSTGRYYISFNTGSNTMIEIRFGVMNQSGTFTFSDIKLEEGSNPTNNSMNVTASTTVTTASDHTLYATWEGVDMYVVLNNKYDSYNPSSTGQLLTVEYNGNYYMFGQPSKVDQIFNSAPTLSGYAFGGYYTGKNGTGTQWFDASGNLTISRSTLYSTLLAANTTATNQYQLYAKWTEIPGTITLTGEIDLSCNSPQYRVYANGEWGSWTTLSTTSVSLTITSSTKLQVRATLKKMTKDDRINTYSYQSFQVTDSSSTLYLEHNSSTTASKTATYEFAQLTKGESYTIKVKLTLSSSPPPA